VGNLVEASAVLTDNRVAAENGVISSGWVDWSTAPPVAVWFPYQLRISGSWARLVCGRVGKGWL
jgi:hypothetical protein